MLAAAACQLRLLLHVIPPRNLAMDWQHAKGRRKSCIAMCISSVLVVVVWLG